MKIRLEGNTKECAAWADIFDDYFVLRYVSRFYPNNRKNKGEGRIYIEPDRVKETIKKDDIIFLVAVTDTGAEIYEWRNWDDIIMLLDYHPEITELYAYADRMDAAEKAEGINHDFSYVVPPSAQITDKEER